MHIAGAPPEFAGLTCVSHAVQRETAKCGQRAGRWREGMGCKILIADDEPNIVAALEFLLAESGFQVDSAADGGQALARLTVAPPDLMLLDVSMPVLSGYEVCQRVRANPAWAGIKIIFLSAHSREVEVDKGLALGADAYLTKPFSTQDLLAKVRLLLGLEAP
jgi:DNA-binding response OmpR family regulator